MSGRRHVTTVRFDADLWERLCATADRLGVHRAELVRDATREHVARLDQTDRLTRLEQRVGVIARTILRLSGRPQGR
ncbi:ribbon-helix-helix domain-containing protein [Conexibacter woesei]|uniref:ribbon-helix-helix domain-containing protein n=1 Tax=Conexibacter woesei TaxID=191495 RepID=UPI0011D18E4C|nr:CopG family transcriptional regulator [Conexibacter woesei]